MSFKNVTWQTRLMIFTVCIFFTSASYTMCVPFLPVYLLELGAPEASIEMWSAVVFSSCFLIAGVMAPIWGKISDIKGKKSMAMRSAILLCLTYSCGGIVTAPIQLLGVRILQGFANGYLPVVLSIVSSQSPREKLGTSLSFIQSAQLVGTVSGPLIGGTLAHIFGYRASFIIAGCFLAIVVLITYLTPVDEPESARSTERSSIFADLKYCFTERSICEILAMVFLFNSVMMAIQPLGAFLAPLWGMMGQKRGYYLTMTVSLLGSGIFIAAQSTVMDFTSLMVLSGLMGVFIVGFVPAINALITIITPANFKGRAFGAITMTAQFLGALIANMLAIRYQFLVSGSVLVLMGIYVTFRVLSMRKSKHAQAREAAAQSAVAAQASREQRMQAYQTQIEAQNETDDSMSTAIAKDKDHDFKA